MVDSKTFFAEFQRHLERPSFGQQSPGWIVAKRSCDGAIPVSTGKSTPDQILSLVRSEQLLTFGQMWKYQVSVLSQNMIENSLVCSKKIRQGFTN